MSVRLKLGSKYYMETKKTIKIIFSLALGAIIIFFLVIFLNNHIEVKNKKDQLSSEAFAKMPVELIANENDLREGSGSLGILVYEDYSDPFSAQFAQTLKRAQTDFSEQLQIIYRPYNAIDSESGDITAMAVLCAHEQSRGLEMREELFKQQINTVFNREGMISLAQNLDLNMEAFNLCLTNPEKKERIEEVKQLAQKFAVYGTPTVFVGSEFITGARPYETDFDSNGDEIEGLRQVIERQLN